MESKITEILDAFTDGKWHTLEAIQQKMGIEEDQLCKIVDFLTEYNFIVLDEKRKKAKLDEKAHEFLTQTATS
jgi:DNA-binding IclR family transcriptional regulator